MRLGKVFAINECLISCSFEGVVVKPIPSFILDYFYSGDLSNCYSNDFGLDDSASLP